MKLDEGVVRRPQSQVTRALSRAASTRGAGFPQGERFKREQEGPDGTQYFCNLISEVISHRFCSFFSLDASHQAQLA